MNPMTIHLCLLQRMRIDRKCAFPSIIMDELFTKLQKFPHTVKLVICFHVFIFIKIAIERIVQAIIERSRVVKNLQTHFVTNAATLRWLRILDIFEENPVCSTKTLAEVSNSTSRTIVSDINDLKLHFGDSVSIESSHRGYVFGICHPGQYLTAMRSLIADEMLFHIVESIFQNELRSSLEWAETYHISESTVLRYLKKIHPVLRAYGLKMQYSPVTFIGKESHIRKFFHDFIMNRRSLPTSFSRQLPSTISH